MGTFSNRLILNMINNFKIIEPLLQFDNPGDCYFVQFLKRKKDNPEMNRNMVNVDNLFIYSLKEYRDMESRIIDIATMHNARAYIRVNRRNTEKLALQTLVKVSNLILSKDYYSVKNAYLSAAGEHNSEPVKRWIVDIDNDTENVTNFDAYKKLITGFIEELHKECNRNTKQAEYKILLEIPTKNGVHIITNPFNLQRFREWVKWPIDIHKDNPTILFIPSQSKGTELDRSFSDTRICDLCDEKEEDGHAEWCPEFKK